MTRLHKEFGLNPTIPICFFCGKEKNMIALLGSSIKEEAQKNMCIDKEPCDECKSYMEQGILIIEVKDNTDPSNPYRTGRLFVLTEEAAIRIFIGFDTTKNRCCFLTEEGVKKIGLDKAAGNKITIH